MSPTPTQQQAALDAAGLNSSQQASVRAGVVDPTIAASSVRRYTGDVTASGGAYGAGAAAATQPGGIFDTAAPDEAKIRADAQTAVQAQVDSIKNTYAGILQQAAVTGQNDLGRTRATAARSGTLGSDFGNAELDTTQKNNDANAQAIAAERDQKITTLLGAADDRATAQIEADKNRAATNSENYLNFLKSNADQAKSDVKDMAAAGLTPDQLPQDKFNQLVDQTGYTPEQLQAEFVLNTPKDQVVSSFTQGNKYYVVTRNPLTGENKTSSVNLGFTVPTDYTTTKMDDGSLVFSPKNPDPTKPLKDQILTYGAPSASYKLDQAQKQATLTKTQLENKALLDKSGADAQSKQDLQDAAAAIAAGADSDKVRQRFLDAHPNDGALFLQYTKQQY